MTICANAPIDTDSIANEISGALEIAGVPQPSIVVQPAASIPRLATGKLKRFIPREVENPPSR